MRTQHYINCLFKSLIKNFSIKHYICDVVAPKQDFDEWIQRRLEHLRAETIYERKSNLILSMLTNLFFVTEINSVLLTSMEVFWDDDCYLLNMFLHTAPQQEDDEESQQVSDELCSLFENDSEGLSYRNPQTISKLHGGNDPSPLLGTVIKKANSQYEIFRVLSQSKGHKIKNKIILSLN